MSIAKPNQRLHYLDSLRGLAALYVVLFHAYQVPIPKPTIASPLLEHAVKFGGTGVYLFFVISGFSLSLTLGRHDRSGAPTLSYAVSRMFRIAPMFYFMLLITLTYHFLHSGKVHPTSVILQNVTFLFNLFPKQVQLGVTSASWTVGVEMLFYLAFLPLVRSPIRTQALTCLASVVAFALLCRYAPIEYARYSFIGFFPMFIFGMWSFEVLRTLRGAAHEQSIGLGLLALGCAALIGSAATTNPYSNIWLRLPIALGYSSILVGSGLVSPNVLELRALRFAGKTSYSLYLLHPLLIVALHSSLRFITARGGYAGEIAAIFAVLIPLAYFTYTFIEVPGERVGKAVLAKLISGGATVTAS